jgi:1-acyl-sn-glycerol-3-phosphate acyltransferase
MNNLPLVGGSDMTDGGKIAQNWPIKPSGASWVDVLRTSLAYLLFGLYLLLMYPLVLILNVRLRPSGSALFVALTRRYVRWMLKTCGVRIKVENADYLESCGTCVLVSNHSSLLDIFTASQAVPLQFRGLAKKEIARIPVIRLYFRLVSVFVERSNPESRLRSLEACSATVKAGASLLIFPEGTRNRTDAVLLPFRDGAFRIAIHAQCPVLPYITPDNRQLLPMTDGFLRRGTARVIFLKPIPTQGLSEEDVPALRERVFDEMHKALLLSVREGNAVENFSNT